MDRTQIRWGTDHDSEAACSIWRESCAWLESIGQPLWRPEQFADGAVQAILDSGRLVVGLSEDHVVACMMTADVDPEIWPETPAGIALYVHKLAVLRSSAGQNWSRAMLDWASAAAKAARLQAVRLDCAPRPPLLRLYTECGFAVVDEGAIQIGGFLIVRLERLVL
ncbi:GNAT family N-acetyltransferase [Bradyrhizobium sp. LHD-71]|uniref:GNAT family N-acetyltransferase n=1 Tax=Bradyrhizobium sp. LHD-71 TaxID=3072141 RepID=UPI00280D5B59|nr:GNAT family N-acetyltransferase [Bradyrhizobium sp. LHD-71]MDQ8732192.1 GNAT family N-acetyltransferase [Bradyrhizobium sp. LHD-71]